MSICYTQSRCISVRSQSPLFRTPRESVSARSSGEYQFLKSAALKVNIAIAACIIIPQKQTLLQVLGHADTLPRPQALRRMEIARDVGHSFPSPAFPLFFLRMRKHTSAHAGVMSPDGIPKTIQPFKTPKTYHLRTLGRRAAFTILRPALGFG